MERYYYHGLEFWPDTEDSPLQIIIDIIKSGAIKTRSSLSGDIKEGMNHICLYKKDETVDYSNRDITTKMSALDGWINNCMVFIISPTINAYQPVQKKQYSRENSETNIFDEWRINENIPLEKIVGLALPLTQIEELSQEEWIDNDTYQKLYLEKLNELIIIAKEYGWIIVNSDEPNFTDKLDATLSSTENKLD